MIDSLILEGKLLTSIERLLVLKVLEDAGSCRVLASRAFGSTASVMSSVSVVLIWKSWVPVIDSSSAIDFASVGNFLQARGKDVLRVGVSAFVKSFKACKTEQACLLFADLGSVLVSLLKELFSH
mgnify:CR=1 FL=1